HSRRRAASCAFGVGAAVLLAACGVPGAKAASTEVEVVRGPVAGSTLVGSWPEKPKVVPVKAPPAPIDPATGYTVSGSIGPPWPLVSVAADAIVPRVALYQSPGVPVPTGKVLTNPTWEGLPLVFLVRNQQPGYLQVQFDSRPNGATAWVKATDVSLRWVPNHVLIELGARKVTVFHGDQAIFSAVVAPGKPSSPTPTGSFFVDGIAKPPNPNGPYGIYQVSFSGFSNVYQTFGSGVGQVAMHGTNEPMLIGTYASHGCVRMSNADITQMVNLAPPGTPVDVVA
ncbi:MAG TPA: L,D-transpeptidase, partial [Acidimicrobiales bacterium]